MSDITKYNIYGNRRVVERVTPRTKNISKHSQPKKRSGNRKIHWWTKKKFQDMRKYIWGFNGRFTMMITMTFEDSAYENPDRLLKSIEYFGRQLKKIIGNGAYIGLLEYGESKRGKNPL